MAKENVSKNSLSTFPLKKREKEVSWLKDRDEFLIIYKWYNYVEKKNSEINSIQFSHSVVSNFLQTHGLQHVRLPCPSPTPRACLKSHPSNWQCHPTTSSSVIPFSFCLQFFLASGSFLMSQLFASDDQSTVASASASVLLMNIQDWVPLGLTGLISLQSKGLSRIFSNTTLQKHKFFSFFPPKNLFVQKKKMYDLKCF